MESTTFNRAELVNRYTEFVYLFGVPNENAWVVIDGRNTIPAPEIILGMAKKYHGATPEAKECKDALIKFIRNTCGIK